MLVRIDDLHRYLPTPKLMPVTMKRCRSRKSAISGKVEITAPVISIAQSVPSCEEKMARPSCSVRDSGLDEMTSGQV